MQHNGWWMPAEWARHAATWMVWPHNQALWETTWGVTLAQVQQDFARVANAIARFEPVKMIVDPSAVAGAKALCGLGIELIEQAVNDSWCRDSGPTFVCHPQLGTAGVSWRFNAWGGKSAYDLDESLARRVLNNLGLACFGTPLSNEGGAIHVDGEGTLITTESVLLNPNRNPGVSKAEIEDIFTRLLGIKKTIWLPGDPDYVTGDMTDGHVDGVCAFARPGVLLVDATHDQGSVYADVVRETVAPLPWLPTPRAGASRCLSCMRPPMPWTPRPRCSVLPTPTSTSPTAQSSCRPMALPPIKWLPRSCPRPSRGARSYRCRSTTWPMAAAGCIASPSNSQRG